MTSNPFIECATPAPRTYDHEPCGRKIDKRIVKTKTAIHEAFIDIIKDKPIDQVTISEVARQAGVSRKTFYTHYSCLNDLLQEHVSKFVFDIFTEVEESNFNATLDDHARMFARRTIEKLHNQWRTNPNYVDFISSAKCIQMMAAPVEYHSYELYRRFGIEPEPHAHLFSAFILGGIFTAYELAFNTAGTSGQGASKLGEGSCASSTEASEISQEQLEEFISQCQRMVLACSHIATPQLRDCMNRE